MIHLLPILEQIRAEGGEIWLAGEKIRYRFPHQPPFPLLEELKQNKADLLYYLQLEQEMKKSGWLILSPLVAYEYRLTNNHSIFIFEESGTWEVWRATWHNKPEPLKEKTISEGLSFPNAVYTANEYIQWFTGQKKLA